jgi:polyprenyl P-hydroxybenzoate/phenylacrylic acid decarboxylase-like protein
MAAGEALAYGSRLVEALHEAGDEVHLVMTREAERALGDDLERVRSLATQVYASGNQAARISSGSFLTRGMIVVPCDGAALAAISLGLATNLVFRAADVTLKEQRPLVLGLTTSAPNSIEQEQLARAAEVPGLVTFPLEGSPDDAVAELLGQL